MADGSLPIRIPAGLAPGALGDEVDVVLFAGGGGSSLAVEEALGKHPDAALNHWPLALAVHQRNFPDAEHHCADVMETDPRVVCAGRRVRLLWLSPDCRHFSAAKGSAPVSPSIRALAWSAIPWAKLRRPRVIVLENVEGFLTWAPVIDGPGGKTIPDPSKKGQTFQRYVRRLRQAGYAVEWRILSAADFGAPTIRKRLFLVARCDGLPIVWPAPTHAPRKVAAERGLRPHRAAAEIIDWSRPCPSIFLTPAEARELRIKRPLQEATLARIAKGLLRYTIACADPFIVPVTHTGERRSHGVDEPLRTVTGANRGEFALVAPTVVGLANRDHDQRPGGRTWSVEDPLRVVTGSNNHALAAAYLTKFSENSTGHLPDEPLHTVMAGAPRHGLVAAFMEQANTDMVGHDARAPVSTIVGRGTTQRLVTAQLSQFRGSSRGAGDLAEPAPTLCSGGHQALLTAALEAEQPLAKPFAREHELRAFLIKYYGEATAQDVADPLGTVTSRSRFGLVVVAAQAFRIVDIGMRMLDPKTELAAAMGVRPDYVLDREADGTPVTKTHITKMVGNMVSPPPAVAILRALFPDAAAQHQRRAA